MFPFFFTLTPSPRCSLSIFFFRIPISVSRRFFDFYFINCSIEKNWEGSHFPRRAKGAGSNAVTHKYLEKRVWLLVADVNDAKQTGGGGGARDTKCEVIAETVRMWVN